MDTVLHYEHISPMRSALLAHWTDEEMEAQGSDRNVLRTHRQSVLTQSSLSKTSGIS